MSSVAGSAAPLPTATTVGNNNNSNSSSGGPLFIITTEESPNADRLSNVVGSPSLNALSAGKDDDPSHKHVQGSSNHDQQASSSAQAQGPSTTGSERTSNAPFLDFGEVILNDAPTFKRVTITNVTQDKTLRISWQRTSPCVKLQLRNENFLDEELVSSNALFDTVDVLEELILHAKDSVELIVGFAADPQYITLSHQQTSQPLTFNGEIDFSGVVELDEKQQKERASRLRKLSKNTSRHGSSADLAAIEGETKHHPTSASGSTQLDDDHLMSQQEKVQFTTSVCLSLMAATPTDLVFNVVPGKSQSMEYSVLNQTHLPLHFVFRLQAMLPDFRMGIFGYETPDMSCLGQHQVLSSHQTEKFVLTVSTTSATKPGSYRAVIQCDNLRDSRNTILITAHIKITAPGSGGGLQDRELFGIPSHPDGIVDLGHLYTGNEAEERLQLVSALGMSGRNDLSLTFNLANDGATAADIVDGDSDLQFYVVEDGEDGEDTNNYSVALIEDDFVLDPDRHAVVLMKYVPKLPENVGTPFRLRFTVQVEGRCALTGDVFSVALNVRATLHRSHISIRSMNINFGDCKVGQRKQRNVIIENHADIEGAVLLQLESKVISIAGYQDSTPTNSREFTCRMAVPPQGKLTLNAVILPRRVNPSYRKQMTVANAFNPNEHFIVNFEANTTANDFTQLHDERYGCSRKFVALEAVLKKERQEEKLKAEAAGGSDATTTSTNNEKKKKNVGDEELEGGNETKNEATVSSNAKTGGSNDADDTEQTEEDQHAAREEATSASPNVGGTNGAHDEQVVVLSGVPRVVGYFLRSRRNATGESLLRLKSTSDEIKVMVLRDGVSESDRVQFERRSEELRRNMHGNSKVEGIDIKSKLEEERQFVTEFIATKLVPVTHLTVPTLQTSATSASVIALPTQADVEAPLTPEDDGENNNNASRHLGGSGHFGDSVATPGGSLSAAPSPMSPKARHHSDVPPAATLSPSSDAQHREPSSLGTTLNDSTIADMCTSNDNDKNAPPSPAAAAGSAAHVAVSNAPIKAVTPLVEGGIPIYVIIHRHLGYNNFTAKEDSISITCESVESTRYIRVSYRLCATLVELGQGQRSKLFGNVPIGDKKHMKLNIVNPCEAPLYFSISKSVNSVTSSHLKIANTNVNRFYGFVRGFAKHELEIVFNPSLRGTFKEPLTITNVLNPANQVVVTMKAEVIKVETLDVFPAGLNLSEVAVESPTKDYYVHGKITLSNTSKQRRDFAVRIDPSDSQLLNNFADVNTKMTVEVELSKSSSGSTRKLEEELDHIEKKLKIYDRKKKVEKAAKARKRIAKLKKVLMGEDDEDDSDREGGGRGGGGDFTDFDSESSEDEGGMSNSSSDRASRRGGGTTSTRVKIDHKDLLRTAMSSHATAGGGSSIAPQQDKGNNNGGNNNNNNNGEESTTANSSEGISLPSLGAGEQFNITVMVSVRRKQKVTLAASETLSSSLIFFESKDREVNKSVKCTLPVDTSAAQTELAEASQSGNDDVKPQQGPGHERQRSEDGERLARDVDAKVANSPDTIKKSTSPDPHVIVEQGLHSTSENKTNEGMDDKKPSKRHTRTDSMDASTHGGKSSRHSPLPPTPPPQPSEISLSPTTDFPFTSFFNSPMINLHNTVVGEAVVFSFCLEAQHDTATFVLLNPEKSGGPVPGMVDAKFKFTPQNGLIQPGQRFLVEGECTPMTPGAQKYVLQVKNLRNTSDVRFLAVDMNPVFERQTIEIEPAMLEFGDILLGDRKLAIQSPIVPSPSTTEEDGASSMVAEEEDSAQRMKQQRFARYFTIRNRSDRYQQLVIRSTKPTQLILTEAEPCSRAGSCEDLFEAALMDSSFAGSLLNNATTIPVNGNHFRRLELPVHIPPKGSHKLQAVLCPMLDNMATTNALARNISAGIHVEGLLVDHHHHTSTAGAHHQHQQQHPLFHSRVLRVKGRVGCANLRILSEYTDLGVVSLKDQRSVPCSFVLQNPSSFTPLEYNISDFPLCVKISNEAMSGTLSPGEDRVVPFDILSNGANSSNNGGGNGGLVQSHLLIHNTTSVQDPLQFRFDVVFDDGSIVLPKEVLFPTLPVHCCTHHTTSSSTNSPSHSGSPNGQTTAVALVDDVELCSAETVTIVVKNSSHHAVKMLAITDAPLTVTSSTSSSSLEETATESVIPASPIIQPTVVAPHMPGMAPQVICSPAQDLPKKPPVVLGGHENTPTQWTIHSAPKFSSAEITSLMAHQAVTKRSKIYLSNAKNAKIMTIATCAFTFAISDAVVRTPVVELGNIAIDQKKSPFAKFRVVISNCSEHLPLSLLVNYHSLIRFTSDSSNQFSASTISGGGGSKEHKIVLEKGETREMEGSVDISRFQGDQGKFNEHIYFINPLNPENDMHVVVKGTFTRRTWTYHFDSKPLVGEHPTVELATMSINPDQQQQHHPSEALAVAASSAAAGGRELSEGRLSIFASDYDVSANIKATVIPELQGVIDLVVLDFYETSKLVRSVRFDVNKMKKSLRLRAIAVNDATSGEEPMSPASTASSSHRELTRILTKMFFPSRRKALKDKNLTLERAKELYQQKSQLSTPSLIGTVSIVAADGGDAVEDEIAILTTLSPFDTFVTSTSKMMLRPASATITKLSEDSFNKTFNTTELVEKHGGALRILPSTIFTERIDITNTTDATILLTGRMLIGNLQQHDASRGGANAAATSAKSTGSGEQSSLASKEGSPEYAASPVESNLNVVGSKQSQQHSSNVSASNSNVSTPVSKQKNRLPETATGATNEVKPSDKNAGGASQAASGFGWVSPSRVQLAPGETLTFTVFYGTNTKGATIPPMGLVLYDEHCVCSMALTNIVQLAMDDMPSSSSMTVRSSREYGNDDDDDEESSSDTDSTSSSSEEEEKVEEQVGADVPQSNKSGKKKKDVEVPTENPTTRRARRGSQDSNPDAVVAAAATSGGSQSSSRAHKDHHHHKRSGRGSNPQDEVAIATLLYGMSRAIHSTEALHVIPPIVAMPSPALGAFTGVTPGTPLSVGGMGVSVPSLDLLDRQQSAAVVAEGLRRGSGTVVSIVNPSTAATTQQVGATSSNAASSASVILPPTSQRVLSMKGVTAMESGRYHLTLSLIEGVEPPAPHEVKLENVTTVPVKFQVHVRGQQPRPWLTTGTSEGTLYPNQSKSLKLICNATDMGLCSAYVVVTPNRTVSSRVLMLRVVAEISRKTPVGVFEVMLDSACVGSSQLRRELPTFFGEGRAIHSLFLVNKEKKPLTFQVVTSKPSNLKCIFSRGNPPDSLVEKVSKAVSVMVVEGTSPCSTSSSSSHAQTANSESEAVMAALLGTTPQHRTSSHHHTSMTVAVDAKSSRRLRLGVFLAPVSLPEGASVVFNLEVTVKCKTVRDANKVIVFACTVQPSAFTVAAEERVLYTCPPTIDIFSAGTSAENSFQATPTAAGAPQRLALTSTASSTSAQASAVASGSTNNIPQFVVVSQVSVQCGPQPVLLRAFAEAPFFIEESIALAANTTTSIPVRLQWQPTSSAVPKLGTTTADSAASNGGPAPAGQTTRARRNSAAPAVESAHPRGGKSGRDGTNDASAKVTAIASLICLYDSSNPDERIFVRIAHTPTPQASLVHAGSGTAPLTVSVSASSLHGATPTEGEMPISRVPQPLVPVKPLSLSSIESRVQSLMIKLLELLSPDLVATMAGISNMSAADIAMDDESSAAGALRQRSAGSTSTTDPTTPSAGGKAVHFAPSSATTTSPSSMSPSSVPPSAFTLGNDSGLLTMIAIADDLYLQVHHAIDILTDSMAASQTAPYYAGLPSCMELLISSVVDLVPALATEFKNKDNRSAERGDKHDKTATGRGGANPRDGSASGGSGAAGNSSSNVGDARGDRGGTDGADRTGRWRRVRTIPQESYFHKWATLLYRGKAATDAFMANVAVAAQSGSSSATTATTGATATSGGSTNTASNNSSNISSGGGGSRRDRLSTGHD